MEKKKATPKKRKKQTFLTQSLKAFLIRQELRVIDISLKAHLPQSTLSNIFAGKRLPSDELVYTIGRGMKLNRNEIAQLFLHLARTRTIGSARELWTDLLERLQDSTYLSEGFVRDVSHDKDDLALIPLYEKAWPGVAPGEVAGDQIGVFPYYGKKARHGAFGLLVRDNSMVTDESFLKLPGFAIFDAIEKGKIPYNKITCVFLPGSTGFLIRRVLRARAGKVLLRPDNPDFKTVSATISAEKNIFFGVYAGFWNISVGNIPDIGKKRVI